MLKNRARWAGIALLAVVLAAGSLAAGLGGAEGFAGRAAGEADAPVLRRDPDGNVIEPAEQRASGFSVHDEKRPAAPVVAPATADQPGSPPGDALVLFDGKDLSAWRDAQGGPARWKVQDGYVEVVKKTGTMQTAGEFGNCQLHIEWATPAKAEGGSQGRGNSGVFLMGRYEIQVLDSYNNPTYADGQAGAVYGQAPPLANVCRRPGEWQSYDIIFLRPMFGEGGLLVRPGRITVLQNGVAIHNNYAIQGATEHKKLAQYAPHGDKGPLVLQEHGNPVRFRNIWIRELPEEQPAALPYVEPPKPN